MLRIVRCVASFDAMLLFIKKTREREREKRNLKIRNIEISNVMLYRVLFTTHFAGINE